MNQVKGTEIEGDVSVGRHVTVGGKSVVCGDAVVKKNLRVEGYLHSHHIRGADKGLFLTEESLLANYPAPQDGWWAMVGERLPALVYVAQGGEWVSTGEQAAGLAVEYRDDAERLSTIQESVNGATSVADNALNTATAAKSAAESASATANGIASVANSAMNTANEAKSAADAARSVTETKGQAGGIAPLDYEGRVPAEMMPGDVVEVMRFAGFVDGVNIIGASLQHLSTDERCTVVYQRSTGTFVLAYCIDQEIEAENWREAGSCDLWVEDEESGWTLDASRFRFYAAWTDGYLYGTPSGFNGRAPYEKKLYVDSSRNRIYRCGSEGLEMLGGRDREAATAQSVADLGERVEQLSEGTDAFAQMVETRVDKIQAQLDSTDSDVEALGALVPAQASAGNQLADKGFVNSSVATNTAEFRGTFDSVTELHGVTGADANDYAFVRAQDSAGNMVFRRYKYVPGTGWGFEYELNNSSFTAAQWATIQSGATAADVEKLRGLPEGDVLMQRPAGGTAAEFVKGDGSLDGNSYAHGDYAYVNMSGATVPGWLRIAKLNSNCYGTVAITNYYSNEAQACIVFSFGTSYKSFVAGANNRAWITQIAGSNRLISKARIVAETSDDQYLEVYFAYSAINHLYISLSTSYPSIRLYRNYTPAEDVQTSWRVLEQIFYPNFATNVLENIKTVDGAGSGLDADLLGGKSAGDYLRCRATTLSAGGVVKIGGLESGVLIDIRGNAGGRCGLAYVSSYSIGRRVRTVLKVVCSSPNYEYYVNGASDGTASLYVKGVDNTGGDSVRVFPLWSAANLSVGVATEVPADAERIDNVDGNVLATRGQVPALEGSHCGALVDGALMICNPGLYMDVLNKMNEGTDFETVNAQLGIGSGLLGNTLYPGAGGNSGLYPAVTKGDLRRVNYIKIFDCQTFGADGGWVSLPIAWVDESYTGVGISVWCQFLTQMHNFVIDGNSYAWQVESL